MRTVWLGRKRGKAPRRRLLTRRLRVGNTLSNARVSCVATVHTVGMCLGQKSCEIARGGLKFAIPVPGRKRCVHLWGQPASWPGFAELGC